MRKTWFYRRASVDGVNVQLGIWTMSCRNSTNQQVLDCGQAGVNGTCTIASNGTYQHTYMYTLRHQSWVEYVIFCCEQGWWCDVSG